MSALWCPSMSKEQYSQGKRQRESEKARKKRAKAERREQRRQEGTRDGADTFEVSSVEDVVGRLPSTSEAMRMIEERARAPRAAATVPCKLFVGSLTDGVTESMLMEIFSEYGKVSEAVIISDRNTNQSRGFAFVTFQNRHDGAKAVEELDGYELDGRNIAVKVATTR